jgi:two-component system response regulator QseB
MHLLLVEDDPELGASLREGLRQRGHAVDWAHDGAEARSALTTAPAEAVLLDLILPDDDGLSLLQEWRANGDRRPILVLTARDAVDDRVSGLDSGADDYLVKPFDLDELEARLRAVHRRKAGGRADPELRVGDLALDPARHTVTQAGEPVALAPREWALLHLLMARAGQVVTKERLETALGGLEDPPDSNVVEVHIHHLRRKLGRERIHTVRGVGYLLDDPT